jgi:hypothetical protein
MYKIVCPYCKLDYLVNRKRRKFCSDNHAKLFWKKNHPEKRREQQRRRWRELHPETSILKICEYCKKEFTTDTKHKYQKYCNYNCRNRFNSTPEKRKIWRKNYRNNHLSEIKEKDFEYKSRVRFGAISKTLNRKTVDERDKRTCQLCKSTNKIVIHHIRYSGKPEDLVSLCRSCHARIHKLILKEPYWYY